MLSRFVSSCDCEQCRWTLGQVNDCCYCAPNNDSWATILVLQTCRRSKWYICLKNETERATLTCCICDRCSSGGLGNRCLWSWRSPAGSLGCDSWSRCSCAWGLGISGAWRTCGSCRCTRTIPLGQSHCRSFHFIFKKIKSHNLFHC